MAQSTAERLRSTGPALEGDAADADLLARVRVLTGGGRLPLRARDEILFEVVQRYRVGPSQRWAAVLLDVMAPPLMKRLQHFSPRPPAIDVEDVAQQFLLHLLEAAHGVPLELGAVYLERRLLLRAITSMSRWLKKEARRQSWVAPLEALSAVLRSGR